MTVPPPDGAEDPYSASTRVGQAPLDLLALVRAAEDDGEDKGPSGPPAALFEVEGELEESEPAPARKPSVPPPVPKRASTPPPAPAKRASTPPPATAAKRASVPPPAPVVRAPARRPPEGDGLPPIAAILLVLGAVALALAAIVR